VKKLICHLLCVAGLLPVLGSNAAQAQQPVALVIEGGTLIDGNGGTPVADSVVVIQGDKIASVGRKGQTRYPPNAQIIKADGKFIVPGLWDAHSYGTWFLNDFYLNHGVTSLIDNGLGGELSIVHKEAVNRGKIAGPRYFISIGSQSTNHRFDTGFEPPLFPDRIPKTPAEARQITKRFIDAGADFIFYQDASLPLDNVAAGIEEAKKAGKPIGIERVSSTLPLTKAVEMGFDYLTHSPGVAETIAKDPSKWRNELDLYADMDDAKAQSLIKLLVQHKATLVPNFINIAPGYARDWKRFEDEEMKLFSNPDILAFYPEATILGRPTALGLMKRGFTRIPTGDPAVLARRREGYRNLLRFHRDFLHAGGRVLTGGNTQVQKAAGLTILHEMEVFVEGGFTPMETIQAATKWPAEAMRVQDRIGTIESGKLADLLVVSADPLQDIHNLQKLETLVFNGKVVDRSYHPWPSDPFMDNGDVIFGNPPVESLAWVLSLKRSQNASGEGDAEGGQQAKTGLPDPPASPQPAIETISPTVVTEGQAATLTIKGFNFVRRMQVFFDGRSVPYKAMSTTELKVMLDESLLRTPGKFDLVLRNAPPVATPDWGNGTSNTAHLLVNFKY
jgi:Amidohydrolase family/IPT/TIG domain